MNNKHLFSPLVRASGLALLVALAAGAPRVAAAQGAGAVLPGGNPHAPVNINAPTLDYFDKEKKLVYSGGVVAKQGDSTLKASSLIILLNNTAGPAPQGDATSATGGNQIRRIEATGPVTIVSKDQVGTGDNGAYDRAENKISLIGHVSLSQGGNVIKGGAESRLVYDLTTGRAQIVGGVSSLFTPGSGGDLPGKQSPRSSSKGGTP